MSMENFSSPFRRIGASGAAMTSLRATTGDMKEQV